MAPSSVLRRLYPAALDATVTIREAYDVERTPPAGRPYVGVCMVTSLDGTVVVGGGSGGLGNAHDVEVLVTLRRLADLVLVGAGTAKGEGYGKPSKAGQRIGVVTNSGRVDLDRELFTSGAGFVVTARSTRLDDSRVEVLRAGDERVDIVEAVSRLGEVVPGVSYVQAEGGPVLNGSLIDHDLVDELDLTLSPHLVGGDGPRLTAGASERLRRFAPAHLLCDDEGFVFSRWVRSA